MNRVFRKSVVLAAAATIAMAVPVLAAPTATFTILGVPDAPGANTGTWTVYFSDSTNDNAGLATFGIDVIGHDGLTVTGSQNDVSRNITGGRTVPLGTKIVNKKTVVVIGTFTAGFNSLNSDGVNGIGITSSQNLAYGAPGANNAILDSLVYQGVGQIDRTANAQATADYNASGVNQVPDWLAVTDIASGTYSGTSGTLSVSVHPGYAVQYLIGTGPGTWKGPANVGAFDIQQPPPPPPPFPHAIIALTGAADSANYGSTVATLSVTGAGNGNYNLVTADIANSTTGTVSVDHFNPSTDIEIFGLKVADATIPGNLATELAVLVADINGAGPLGLGAGVASLTAPAGTGGIFAGDNLFLTFAGNELAGTGSPFLGFDFSIANDINLSDTLSVSSVTVVPEPSSVSALGLAAASLLGRKRRCV